MIPASRRHQSGQALIYGLFVLIGGLAALFFLFNSGQLVREKTKLVNTADAVAYSGGVMNARALNFHAYTNRAMVANTVAIAQLVSLSSWVQYANILGTVGQVTLAASIYKYPIFYPSYVAAATYGLTLQESLNESGALEKLATGSDQIIRQALMGAQLTAHLGLLPARKEVMDQVAAANYQGDGDVLVDPVPLTVAEYTDFVKRHGGNERTRFAEATEVSAKKDPFVQRRSWVMPALFSPGCYYIPGLDHLARRGGTELLGFDEWKAVDSLSEWVWVANKFGFCNPGEHPAGWGSTSAADNATMLNPDPSHYDNSMVVNPLATVLGMMTTKSWDYKGLPSFYDLSADAMRQEDPKLLMAIRVRRNRGQMQVSGQRSEIGRSENLNAYEVQTAGGDEMAAVSAAEVFFQREGDSRDNVYGQRMGKPQEVGSLFNPFWQVRLAQSDDYTRAARALQGVVLP